MKTIKRLLLGLTLGLLLTSCSTEEVPQDNCMCGLIDGAGMDYSFGITHTYPATLRINIINECTGELQYSQYEVESRQEDDILWGIVITSLQNQTPICVDELTTISNQYN